jgi:hypothetical protein
MADQTAETMRAIAEALDESLNPGLRGKDKKVGFVVLLFNMNDPAADARANYISNGADRKDMAAMFKEIIARWEGQPEIKGHG